MGSDQSIGAQGWRIDTIKISECLGSPPPPLPSSSATSASAATSSATATPSATSASAAADCPTGSTEVAIGDFFFDPDTTDIVAGETVCWTNTGEIPHTVTSDTGVFDSGFLDSGEIFTYTFDTVGSYPYHCLPHPFMTAIVNVGPAPHRRHRHRRHHLRLRHRHRRHLRHHRLRHLRHRLRHRLRRRHHHHLRHRHRHLPPPPPPPVRCRVPRVIGLKLAKAKTKIRRAHCSVGRVRRARSRRVGRVIGQTPRPGTRLRRGGRVRLVVGKRDRFLRGVRPPVPPHPL